MSENNKIVVFVLALCAVVALTLTGIRQATATMAEENEKVFNRRAILSALADNLDTPVDALDDDRVNELFENQIEQYAVNMEGQIVEDMMAEELDLSEEKKKPEPDRMLPIYVYNKGGEKYYIISVRGNGLWDEIWGNIALQSDLSTIAGASFDHAGETPGLGAEIKDNPTFPSRFKGKSIYRAYNDTYTGVVLKKGGAAADDQYAVDGISGATVTADGVTEMLNRGIAYYEPYLRKLKAETKN